MSRDTKYHTKIPNYGRPAPRYEVCSEDPNRGWVWAYPKVWPSFATKEKAVAYIIGEKLCGTFRDPIRYFIIYKDFRNKEVRIDV